MRLDWFTCAVLFILAIHPSVTFATEKSKLNVLLICVDDLKPVLGCYGDALAKTPNIDRLAARGMRFDAAYCNQAVCAPSRNALLTGLRSETLGIYDLATNFRQSRPNAVTLPQQFRTNGYTTQALGKLFHVGHGNHEDPASWTVPHWKSNVVGYALPESKAPQGLTREEALFDNQPAANLPRGAAFEAADVADNAYADGTLADEAIRRLEAAAQQPDQPFFLGVGFAKPHLPFCAPQKYWDQYDRAVFPLAELRTAPEGAPGYAATQWGELRQYKGIPEEGALPEDLQRTLIHGYYAATSYMDAQVGRLLAALETQGLANKTVIVLWGDHGWHLGDHGQWCKHSNYEQATRIPLIVVVPGITTPGSVSRALIETVDIYPTLCEIARVPAPADLDGRSQLPVLRQAVPSVKDHIRHVFPRSGRIGRALRTERYRLVEWKQPGAPAETAELELYDYQVDPAESKNLATSQPQVVAELRAQLAQYPEARPQIKPRSGSPRTDTPNPLRKPNEK
jgi:iduronate 2-sulfatase